MTRRSPIVNMFDHENRPQSWGLRGVRLTSVHGRLRDWPRLPTICFEHSSQGYGLSFAAAAGRRVEGKVEPLDTSLWAAKGIREGIEVTFGHALSKDAISPYEEDLLMHWIRENLDYSSRMVSK